jgi:hypothetical protein
MIEPDVWGQAAGLRTMVSAAGGKLMNAKRLQASSHVE